jgi:CysZ protein
MAIPANTGARLGHGALLPLRAIGWLGRHPELWGLALLPVILTGVGLLAGLVAAAPLSGWLLSLAWAEPQGWLLALWWLSRAAVFVSVVYVAAVALPVLVAAPVTDQLSARVELLELGALEAGGGLRRVVAETAVGLAHSVARVLRLLLGYALLLPALLVPFAWPVLAFLWTAWWSGAEWLGLPMARHLHRFGEVRAALRAVRPQGFGMGLTLAGLFLVPFANLLVIPVGAVAGTLLYVELVRSGVVHRRGLSDRSPGATTPAAR